MQLEETVPIAKLDINIDLIRLWYWWLSMSCREYADLSTGVLKRDETQTKPHTAGMVIVTLSG